MRLRGLILASVAATALLAGCTTEVGETDGTVVDAKPSTPPPPPPMAESERALQGVVATRSAKHSRQEMGRIMPAPVIMAPPEPEFRDQYEDIEANPVRLTSEEP
ncbi:MAG: Ca-activated chloride channel family protein, partial [Hyphomonas sp.]